NTLIHLWDMTTPTFRSRTMMLGSNIGIWFDQTAFSPDGSMVAVVGAEGANAGVWVLDTETGREVAILRDNHSPVWSSNSRLLATAGPGAGRSKGQTFKSTIVLPSGFEGENTILNLWEVTPPTPTYLISESINSLSFGYAPAQIASNGTLWAFKHDKLIPSNQTLPSNYTFFDKSDRLWATDFERRQFPIKFWQLSPEKREIVLESPDYAGLRVRPEDAGAEITAKPAQFSISPDGKFLLLVCQIYMWFEKDNASRRGGTTLELWDLVTQKQLTIWNQDNLKRELSCVSFSPDGKRVATCSSGVVIWDAATGKVLRTLGQDGVTSMLVFSPDSKLIFSGTRFHSTNSWGIVVNEVETGRELGTWRGHEGPITALAIHRDGYYLASGGEDRSICLWEVPAGSQLTRWLDPAGHLLNRWEAHKTVVKALAFDTGSTLVTGGADGTLKLWDTYSIRKGQEALGLSYGRPVSRSTIISMTLLGVAFLIVLAGLVLDTPLRKRLGLKLHYLPPMLFAKIGISIFVTAILLVEIWPGADPLSTYSTRDYIQRLLLFVPTLLLMYLSRVLNRNQYIYLLFAKWLPRLGVMKKKQLQDTSVVRHRER